MAKRIGITAAVGQARRAVEQMLAGIREGLDEVVFQERHRAMLDKLQQLGALWESAQTEAGCDLSEAANSLHQQFLDLTNLRGNSKVEQAELAGFVRDCNRRFPLN